MPVVRTAKGGRVETAALLSIGSLLMIVGGLRVAREPRRLSTGLILLAAVALLGMGAGAVIAGAEVVVPSRAEWVAVAAFCACVAGIALAANGFAVIHREGRSPTTFTPVAVGLGLVLLAAGLAVVAGDPPAPTWITQLIAVCCVLGGYLVVHLLAFAGYALLYSNLPDRPEADAIVVLGCGLNRRSVTPLLGARLDRALRAYRVAVSAGALPVIVTCGGQGDDEATSEADAMARYLAAHGIPMNAVVRERHSHNTAENLENCVRELALRGIPAEQVRMTVVTSNFHVLRTAALTRRLGIDAQVVGARTAGYFIPAAFLREYFAVLTTHYRRTHLAAVAITVAALTAVVANAALPPR